MSPVWIYSNPGVKDMFILKINNTYTTNIGLIIWLFEHIVLLSANTISIDWACDLSASE